MTPQPTASTHRGFDGDPIAVVGVGDEPGVLFVHANGFCKELWLPVARESGAATDLGWLSIDQRGHGDSAEGSFPYRWDHVARDVGTIVDSAGSLRIGVGHSSGGAALARAEVLEPGRFERLVLIEPILFPPPHGRWEIPLALAADRRRAGFETRDLARQRFASGPFSDWADEALDLYIDHAFRVADEGWVLKCKPAVEADYYREGNNVDTWDRLDQIDVPVTLVAGAASDSHQEPYLSALADRFRHVEVVVLEDVGHLVPMQRPDLIAGILDRVAEPLR